MSVARERTRLTRVVAIDGFPPFESVSPSTPSILGEMFSSRVLTAYSLTYLKYTPRCTVSLPALVASRWFAVSWIAAG
jgi:hypothetical protein